MGRLTAYRLQALTILFPRVIAIKRQVDVIILKDRQEFGFRNLEVDWVKKTYKPDNQGFTIHLEPELYMTDDSC